VAGPQRHDLQNQHVESSLEELGSFRIGRHT
jgi:hypothetical protein